MGKAEKADAEPDILNHYELQYSILSWSELGDSEQVTEEVVGMVQDLSVEQVAEPFVNLCERLLLEQMGNLWRNNKTPDVKI